MNIKKLILKWFKREKSLALTLTKVTGFIDELNEGIQENTETSKELQKKITKLETDKQKKADEINFATKLIDKLS